MQDGQSPTLQVLSTVAENIRQQRNDVLATVTSSPDPTLTVGFQNERFSTPRFVAKITETSDNVDVHVKDGLWENLPTQHGLWGHWTDDISVYSGPFAEQPIKEIVLDAATAWYERVKNNDVSGMNQS